MNMAVIRCLLPILFGLFSHQAYSQSGERDTLQHQAQQCSHLASKLERLYCFDELFSTPLAEIKNEESGFKYPAEWQRAQFNEESRKTGGLFILGRQQSNPKNVWLTAPAIGAVPPRPILMLSCIDGISRVELSLSQNFDLASIRVAVNQSLAKSQRWLVDESGYIIRSGRGIPAIRLMRSMVNTDNFTLVSDNARINGLKFESKDLGKKLKALRKICQW